MRALGIKITEEVIDKNKWYAFWDAPLEVPEMRPVERTLRDIGLPRKPEEVRRATASFNATSCNVKTDSQWIEVTFPRLAAGIFEGNLRFTMYRGTNLIRMIAKTDEQSVASRYEAGLRSWSHSPLSSLAHHFLSDEVRRQKIASR